MKKLALATVAFAAVCAHGAGNAFAQPVVIYDNSGFSGNDYANWSANPLGGATLTGTSNVSSNPATVNLSTSIVSQNGIKVTATYSPILGVGGTGSLFYGVQGGGGSTGVSFGMLPGQGMLWGNTASGTGGAVHMSFSKSVAGVGFYISPAGFAQAQNASESFIAEISFTGKTALGSPFMNSSSVFGTISSGCSGSSCTFISATAGPAGGITGFTITLLGDTPGAFEPAISNLQLQDEPQPPPSGVPEPASLSLLGAGLLGLGAMQRRRRAGEPSGGWRWSSFGRWRVSGLPPDNSSS